jgi:putative ABC transport system permease protein
VLVRLRDPDRTDRVVVELAAPLAQQHLVAHSWREVYAEVAAGLVWVNLVITVLFSIIVGVVLSGIANTQLIAVFEQMRVLGTLRSIGMSRRGVGALVVAQTALTGLLGSALGLALGALAVRVAAVRGIDMGPQLDGIARVIYPVLSADVAAFCLFVSVVVSALAAAYPAYVAGRMRPVQALAFQ